MTKTYTFPYGDGSVAIDLDETQVRGELHGRPSTAIQDLFAAVREALDHPIESAPLSQRVRPGDRVTLIISDMSRFWMRQDRVVPLVVEYLNEVCGVPDEAITVLVANGTHAGGSEADLRTLVTDAIYDRLRVVNHDCEAPDLIHVGTTSYGTPVELNPLVVEADCVVTIGACTHHVMAGYGGGRKSILPGVASLASIRANHAYALDPAALRSNRAIGNGKLEGNPLHADMTEAAGMVENLFVVNLVLNGEMALSQITAGHFLSSWLVACEAVNDLYYVPIREQAEVVIASCGGYPKDMSLYQGTKTIDNVETGLKPGGTLILLIEAREGGGPGEYFDWIGPWVDGTMEARLRSGFTIPGYIFFLNCEQASRYNILLYSKVDPAQVAPMGLRAYSDMDALLEAADLDGKGIYVIPNGSTVIPHLSGGDR